MDLFKDKNESSGKAKTIIHRHKEISLDILLLFSINFFWDRKDGQHEGTSYAHARARAHTHSVIDVTIYNH